MSASRASANLLVLQCGGPTAVLNASLYGVIAEARQHRGIRRILGAPDGVAGLLKDEVMDLSFLPRREVQRLKLSPGASLGSTRLKLTDADVERVVHRLREREVGYLLIMGGNGTMRGADALARGAAAVGHPLGVIGIPKTIDNDIPLTDRCPGFGSAARYVAQSVRDLAMDVRSLPQPVSIFETMGRTAGWLAGASVLARGADDEQAPHLVYLPERPFEIDRFLGDLDAAVAKRGWAVVVVPEGLQDAAGRPVVESAAAAQRDALSRPLAGGVSAHLAELAAQRLGIRCRWEKPGLCGRASSLHVSPVDRDDAERVGRAAVRAALGGMRGQMVALRSADARSADARSADVRRADARQPDSCDFVPLADVAASDARRVPAGWTSDPHAGVTADFVHYVRPIVGGLVDYPPPLKDQRPTKPSLQTQTA